MPLIELFRVATLLSLVPNPPGGPLVEEWPEALGSITFRSAVGGHMIRDSMMAELAEFASHHGHVALSGKGADDETIVVFFQPHESRGLDVRRSRRTD